MRKRKTFCLRVIIYFASLAFVSCSRNSLAVVFNPCASSTAKIRLVLAAVRTVALTDSKVSRSHRGSNTIAGFALGAILISKLFPTEIYQPLKSFSFQTASGGNFGRSLSLILCFHSFYFHCLA